MTTALTPTAATDAGEAADPLPPVVLGSLSPSRAADFKSCPLLYRYRCIDRLPQSPSLAASRGTLVHSVLESLFDLPAAERTLDAARSLVPAAWDRLRAENPQVEEMFRTDEAAVAQLDQPGPGVDGSDAAVVDGSAVGSSAAEPAGAVLADWLASAGDLLANYFRLEDPAKLEPAEREHLVEVVSQGVRLRGYVDRIDVSPAGDLRVVDYKTGATPREAFEGKALFQMKFYALVLWRTRGVVPRQLRLIYLADTDTLSYAPDAEELLRFERTLMAIWAAIQRAVQTGDFRPNPSRLCDWCDFKAYCPSWGGTPPPYPELPVLTDPRDPAPAGPISS